MQAFAEALCERLRLKKLDEHFTSKTESDIRPSYVALALLTLGTLYLISEYSTYWTSMLVGLLFPVYLTYKCLTDSDKEDTEDNEDERKFWLVYWIIFGLVEVLESIFKAVLFKLPLYNIIKLTFLIWLQHPSTRGAITIYEKTLKNILMQHQQEIDDHLLRLRRFSQHKKMFDDVIKSAKKQALERIVS